MKRITLPPAPIENYEESVRLADESPDFVFSTKGYTTGKIYLFAAPKSEVAATDPIRLAAALSHDAPVVIVNSHIRTPLYRRHLKHTDKGEHTIEMMRIADSSLAGRYDELRALIEKIGAKALVINLFEKAARTSRHRDQLNEIFAMLQEDLDIAIFVYSRENIERLCLVSRNHRGAIGALAYDAGTPVAVGEQTVMDEMRAKPPYIEWMSERMAEEKRNPPPKPELNIATCEEFTDYLGGEMIHPDDLQRQWAKGEMMNDELGMMNVERGEVSITNEELGITNEERGEYQNWVCHSEAIAEESGIA